MDNYGILISLVVLLIFIFVIVMELRKSSDKKTAVNFLQDLGDEILDVILKTISETSPKDFKSLEDFNFALTDLKINKENLIIGTSKAWYYSGDLYGGEI